MDTPTTSPDTCSSTKKTDKLQHGYWVQQFAIPWSKMPQSLIDACERKVRPKPRDRREMVRILCDSIRNHSTLPGRENLSKIANMVVTKYKESFCDIVGDTVVGTGYESLRKQLEERLFNLSRKKSKSSSILAKLAADDGNSEPPAKMKKPVSDSYGCVNWQPDAFPENENDETQKEKQQWLIREHPKDVVDKPKVKLLMKQTYTSQRLLINRQKPMPPTINEIKELWPFLFCKDYLLQHFEELMGFQLQAVFQKTVEQKSSVIYDYMKQEVSKKKVKQSIKLIEDTMALQESKAAIMAGVCLLLLAYFDEEEDNMIRFFDVSNICFCLSLVSLRPTCIIAKFHLWSIV